MNFFPKSLNHINNIITLYMSNMLKSEWDYNYRELIKSCKKLRFYADKANAEMYNIYLKDIKEICNKLHINFEYKLSLIKLKLQINPCIDNSVLDIKENGEVIFNNHFIFKDIQMYCKYPHKSFLLRNYNGRNFILVGYNLKYNKCLNFIMNKIKMIDIKQYLSKYDDKFNDYSINNILNCQIMVMNI